MASLMIASPYSGQSYLPNGSVGISTDPQDTARIIGSISDNAATREKSFLEKLLGVASSIIGDISINKSGGSVSVVRSTQPTTQYADVRIPGTYDPNAPRGIAGISPIALFAGAALLYILLKD